MPEETENDIHAVSIFDATHTHISDTKKCSGFVLFNCNTIFIVFLGLQVRKDSNLWLSANISRLE